MQSSIPPAISYKLANLGFVCAILVVFIHIIHPVYEKFNPTWWVCTFLQGSISCIAVPFFFFASGYFFAGHLGEEGWWRKGLRKRIGTLLVPYFLWNALFLALYGGVHLVKLWQGIPIGGEDVSWNLYGIVSAFGLNPFTWSACGVLWYVRTLLVFMALSPILLMPLLWGRRWGIAWMVILALTYVCLMPETSVNVEPDASALTRFAKRFLPEWGLFYFSAGVFLRRWPVGLSLPKVASWGLLLLGWAGLICMAIGYLPIPYMKVIFLMVALIGAWGVIPVSPWPKWLISLAFPIYVMHTGILWRFSSLGQAVPFINAFLLSPAGYLAQGMVAIVIAGGVTLALRRWMPRMAGVLFGGR